MNHRTIDITSGRRKAVLAALCFAAIAAAAPSRAAAQASPEAEKLFRDGKALMKAGKLAEACSAFEASERSEHNVATVMSLADCREKNQQYASAWAGFLQADSQTRNEQSKAGAAINAVAKKRAAALENRLSYLTINVPDESRIEGLVVTRDDITIEPGAYNRAMPVDGGEHTIAGHAPGHEAWSTKITLDPENDKKAVEVPKFKELPKLVNPPPGEGPGVTIVPEPDTFTPMRVGAASSLGVGVLAVGGSLFAGYYANKADDEAKTTCVKGSCDDAAAARANALRETARKRSRIANVAGGVAIAAVIAAGVLWYLGAPEETETAPAATDTAFHVAPVIGGDTNGFVLTRNF
jgi:hypothetical protein